MQWLPYLVAGAAGLGVIWLVLLSLIVAHQGGTIRQLVDDGRKRDGVLADISRRLDDLVDEAKMRRIIREEMPGRRRDRPAAGVTFTGAATVQGPVAGGNVQQGGPYHGQ